MKLQLYVSLTWQHIIRKGLYGNSEAGVLFLSRGIFVNSTDPKDPKNKKEYRRRKSVEVFFCQHFDLRYLKECAPFKE